MSRTMTDWCRYLVIGVTLFATITLAASLRADDPPPVVKKGESEKPDVRPPTDKELTDERMVFMKSALGRYSIRVGDRKERAPVLDPCLRWSLPNGAFGAAYGIVSVYSYKGGRPAAVGKFFKNGLGQWVNQFTIVPDGDVSIQRGDHPFWKPKEFVCKFTDLPNSPVPSDKPALRLTQMRAIAADFKVVDHFGPKSVKENLRVLPQPGYRYSEQGSILDGALFFLVHDTNPECCLLLECESSAQGATYRFALAPMTIYRLDATYKDKDVWTWPFEKGDAGRSKRAAYFADVYDPEPGEKVPE
jgi:hypothetical protein